MKGQIMSWQKNVTEKISDVMRFLAYACLATDLIVLAGFTVWFSGKFLYFFVRFLNRTIFGNPW